MRFTKIIDISVNVVLPVLLGSVIYLLPVKNHTYAMIRNFLPDGLWAYSFLSCILIIWNRQIHIYWSIFLFLLAIGIELLQFFHFIDGTGDIWDIVTYFLFFTIALFSNKYFKFKLKYKTKTT